MKNNKKGLIVMCLALVLIIVTGCQEQAHDPEQYMPQAPIEVEFFTDPSTDIKVGEEVQLLIEVTQEGELVDDAHPVRFEIWHEAEDDASTEHGNHTSGHGNGHGHGHQDMKDWETPHQMLDGEHIEGGTYGLSYVFEKEGTYFVMYHVDARGYHAMTRHEVIVQP